MALFEVELIPRADVAKMFSATPSKISAAIRNGTLPIGFVAGGKQDGDYGGNEMTYIIKKRLEAYCEAHDLRFGTQLLTAMERIVKGNEAS